MFINPQENLFLLSFCQKIDTNQGGNCTTGNGYNASRKYWELSKIKYTWRTDWIHTTWYRGISGFCSPTTYGKPSLGIWKLNTRNKTQIIQEQKTWNSLQNSVRNPMPRLEAGISPWNVFLFWSFWCNLNSGWGSLPLIFYGNIHSAAKNLQKPQVSAKNSSSSPNRIFHLFFKLSGRQSIHKPPKGHGPVLIYLFHYFFTSSNYYFKLCFFLIHPSETKQKNWPL